MGDERQAAGAHRNPWQAWKAFGLRRGRLAALSVLVFGALVHAVLSHTLSTAHADEIEALLDELYVFQCVPLEPVTVPGLRSGPAPAPLADQLRELDLVSVRVLLIEREVDGLGSHREEAARVVADVLRFDPDLNARAGAVLALAHMGQGAAPALPELMHTVANDDEDIRLGRLILDRLPDIGPAPDDVVPVLSAMLESEPDVGLRSKVAKALSELGVSPGR